MTIRRYEFPFLLFRKGPAMSMAMVPEHYTGASCPSCGFGNVCFMHRCYSVYSTLVSLHAYNQYYCCLTFSLVSLTLRCLEDPSWISSSTSFTLLQEKLFRLSWTFHWPTLTGATAYSGTLLRSFTRTINSCRWDSGQ